MNVTKQLYQWDTGQKLTECTGIYVDFLIESEVYRVEVKDGTCIIPDELLQTSGRYKVWECMADNTLREFAFKVLPRPIPPNYVFTPTEQLTFEGLVQKETNKFNTNAIEKLNAYNANADNRVAEFDSHTEQIQTDISELKSDLVDITEHDIGKNIFFSEWTEKGQTIDMDTGADKTDTASHRTGYVEVEENTTYTMSTDFGRAPSVYVFFYDANKNFLSRYDTPYGFYPKTFTTPENTKYFRVRQTFEAMPTNFQVEKGSIATSYEAPYNRLVVPASVVKDIPKELPTDGEVGQFLKKTLNGSEWANVSDSFNMSYKGKKFLFLGDSITAMSGDASWVDKFNVLAEVGESYNQAVGGAKWCDDESGITYNGTPYSSQNFIGNQVAWCQNIGFAQDKFDYIFISAGTNDTNFTFPTDEQIESEMYNNDSTIKPLSNVDRTTWMGAIRWSIETLRGMYPNAKIILVTPLQRRVDMDGTTLKDMYSIIRQKRETIIKMAKRMGVYVIDTSECDITNFDSTDFADNLHPSAKGAEKLAKFIFKKSIHIFCEYN